MPGVDGSLAQLADGPEKANPTWETILLQSLLDFLFVQITKNRDVYFPVQEHTTEKIERENLNPGFQVNDEKPPLLKLFS